MIATNRKKLADTVGSKCDFGPSGAGKTDKGQGKTKGDFGPASKKPEWLTIMKGGKRKAILWDEATGSYLPSPMPSPPGTSSSKEIHPPSQKTRDAERSVGERGATRRRAGSMAMSGSW